MKYYKVLKNDGSCCNGGAGKWYLPKKQKDGSWRPGKWMPEIEGELEPCENGYHICRPQDLVHWLDEAIFEVEYDGEMVEDDDKCVVRKAQLLSKLETWNDKISRLFASDCAEHVLHIYEDKYPDDDRPRKAIQAARDYANGLISCEELQAAWAAGEAAAGAARAAAWAAKAAAWAAGEAAAGEAARAAAKAAAWAAAGAAWEAAARAAGEAAAGAAAARAAGEAAEVKWQTEKLMEVLGETNK